jgi:predicted ABC-type ATPase
LLGTTAINPDDLTHQVRRGGLVVGAVGADLVGVERAEKAVWRKIAELESVAVETVLSTDKYLPALEAARRRGFRTRLVFVALPRVELAVDRVNARVQLGGHGVAEEQIRRRWLRSHENLRQFSDSVDDLLVFSNADLTPLLAAERTKGAASISWLSREALPEVWRVLG